MPPKSREPFWAFCLIGVLAVTMATAIAAAIVSTLSLAIDVLQGAIAGPRDLFHSFVLLNLILYHAQIVLFALPLAFFLFLVWLKGWRRLRTYLGFGAILSAMVYAVLPLVPRNADLQALLPSDPMMVSTGMLTSALLWKILMPPAHDRAATER